MRGPGPGTHACAQHRAVWNTGVVQDPTSFTDPDNWAGRDYELSLEIGDSDEERLQRAVGALWRAAAVTGCYGSSAGEPADQVAVPITVAALEKYGQLLGTTRPAQVAGSVVCGCFQPVSTTTTRTG